MYSEFWRGYAGGMALMFGIIIGNFHFVKTWDTRKHFEEEAILNKAGKYVRGPEGELVFLWTYCPQDQVKE